MLTMKQRLAFKVEIEYQKHFDSSVAGTLTQSDPTWEVLEPYGLEITVSLTRNRKIPVDHEFSLVVDTAKTGLQISSNGRCNWSNPDSQSNWFIAPHFNRDEASQTLKMVRCDRGDDNNRGITMMVRKKTDDDNGAPFARVPNIIQPWVRENPHVRYWIRGMSVSVGPDGAVFIESIQAVPGLFPAGHSGDIAPDLINKENYLLSANVWNQVQGSNLYFEPAPDSESAGVKIVGFGPDAEKKDSCRTKNNELALACATRDEIRILNPPYTGKKLPPISDMPSWTADYDDYQSNWETRAYLLTAIVHELGHTVSLFHSANRGDIMYGKGILLVEMREIPPVQSACMYVNDPDLCGLGESDKDAIQILYPSP